MDLFVGKKKIVTFINNEFFAGLGEADNVEENREDIRLLKKIAKGSRSAFDRFYETIVRLCFKLLCI